MRKTGAHHFYMLAGEGVMKASQVYHHSCEHVTDDLEFLFSFKRGLI